ncbi:MAG TPA: hypothetical protein VE338_06865 [Ktedonobacterales bacterium]|jgi:hypothetical protein|nr:hypothetical protein [Ktedonobacterales bacterium]
MVNKFHVEQAKQLTKCTCVETQLRTNGMEALCETCQRQYDAYLAEELLRGAQLRRDLTGMLMQADALSIAQSTGLMEQLYGGSNADRS